MCNYNVKIHVLNKIHAKMFKTWKEVTYIHKYRDTLYIQMQTNIYARGVHLVVQGFIPVSTVVVYVTMDN
jgi:hypothetical protein